jgi:hypothetical protein
LLNHLQRFFSSGISSGSLASIGGGQQRIGGSSSTTNDHNKNVHSVENHILPNGNIDKSNSLFDVNDFLWSTNDSHHAQHHSYHEDLETSTGILEDPFDAEWAALAMRNTASKNPFINDKVRDTDTGVTGLKKAFELQM